MTAIPCVCGHPRAAHIGGQGRCAQRITVLGVVDVPCACASWAPATAAARPAPCRYGHEYESDCGPACTEPDPGCLTCPGPPSCTGLGGTGCLLPDTATEGGPAAVLAELGAIWSDDFGAYASGELDASKLHCALCQCAPCRCPAFGTDAYFALLDQRHGRPRAQCAQCGRPITRTAPGAPWTAADTLPAAGCAHVPAGAQ